MTELVERLKTLQDHYSTSGQLGPENRRIFAEAAFEIERQRRQIRNLEELVASYRAMARS